MKNRFRYAAVIGCLTLGASLTSCTDWLTLYPMDKIVEENFWEDKKDLESVRNSAYKNMISPECMERYMVWGELRSDNFDKKPGISLADNIQKIMDVNLRQDNNLFDWSSFYTTINYCNKVIQHGPEILQKDYSFSEGDWQAICAEMYALRALNYFYLTRTFNAIPLVFNSIDDDTQVKITPVSTQNVVLDSLVNQLEWVTTNLHMASNYGSNADNKAFITDKAVYTILADIYLWRASLKESTDKAAADEDYRKCIETCQKVIDLINKDYDKNQGGHGGSFPSIPGMSENKYHLVQNYGVDGAGLTENAYNEIFGTGKNSSESIFELQFDNQDNKNNNLVSNYFHGADNPGSFVAGLKIGPVAANAGGKTVDGLFTKTDLRRFSTLKSIEDNQFAIIKYAALTVDQTALKDNTTATGNKAPQYSMRNVNNANWIFYRISDVLLIKAEAHCMLGTEADLKEAFDLVNEVYKRSNIMATNSSNGALNQSSFADKAAMEDLILRERQREFFGEGKRWFDIVRYALRRGNTDGPKQAFELFKGRYSGDLLKPAQTKYNQNINVMYAPYTETEIKASNNTLKQNPVWGDDNTIEKN